MLALDRPLDARPLAVARIGIGLGGALAVAEAFLVSARVVSGQAIAVPMWSWVPELTQTSAQLLGIAGLLGGVCVALGLLTRAMAVVLACSLAGFVVVEQQTYSNHLTLACWLALWLAVSRADARWSLTARAEGPRDVVLGDQILLMTQISVVYAFTGLVKINPRFLSGEVIQEFSWWDIPDPLAAAMATGAVVTEVLLAVGLWFRRTRLVAALAGLVLHIAIPATMISLGVTIFSVLVLCTYPLFFARAPRLPVSTP